LLSKHDICLVSPRWITRNGW